MQINWLSSEACNKSRKEQEICQRKVLLEIVKQSLGVFLEEVSAFSINWSKKPVYVRGDNNTWHFFVTQFKHSVLDSREKNEHRKHST